MIGRIALGLVVCAVLGTGTGQAQQPYNLAAPVRNLATLFTDLYGPNGLIVDSEATLPGEQPHSAHFNSDFQADFSQFSTALVGQLVSVPLPSPASGFTYRLDPTLGVFQRTTQSFGPILAERADTIGANHLAVGFAIQRFTFDTVEGLDLRAVPAVFTHDNAALLGGRQDVVTTTNSIKATVSQSTTFVTFGVTDRFDVSVALPIVDTSLEVVSTATIRRIGTTNPLTHFFRQSNGDIGDTRLFTAIGSATGIGDITVRFKSTIVKRASSGMAAGIDLRVPTGDPMNLLGTGAAGVQPFAVWSRTWDKVSPHLNASYTWNGSSVLAGNPASGHAADFPDQAGYAAGADIGVNQHVTLALDLLGRWTIDAERLREDTFHALNGTTTFPTIAFARESFATTSGALGLKVNVAERLLAQFNVLFALDQHGLRDRVTPLVGFQYTF
ncbi:MAG TPA: hypothetical protein VI258_13610 [Rhodanobacteraceae bacterium]